MGFAALYPSYVLRAIWHPRLNNSAASPNSGSSPDSLTTHRLSSTLQIGGPASLRRLSFAVRPVLTAFAPNPPTQHVQSVIAEEHFVVIDESRNAEDAIGKSTFRFIGKACPSFS
jgi:hypothetical protein